MSQNNGGGPFIDGPTPPLPYEILGFPAEDLHNVVASVQNFAHATGHPMDGQLQRIVAGLYVYPLLENYQYGKPVTPADVRPYRRPIKELTPNLERADGAALFFSFLGGLPRILLNRGIERHFPTYLPHIRDKARDLLKQLEPDVEFVAQIDNPRELFIEETHLIFSGLISGMTDDPRTHTRKRVACNATEMWHNARQDPDGLQQELPLYSHFMFERLPKKVSLPGKSMLKAMAPDLVAAFQAPLPLEAQRPDISESLRRRGAIALRATPGVNYARVDTIAGVAPYLLPSVHNVLPTSGAELLERFHAAQDFLQPA